MHKPSYTYEPERLPPTKILNHPLLSPSLFLQMHIQHPPVSHITTMRAAVDKIMPLNGRRHLCLVMTASYDAAPQEERAGVIRLITLMRRRGVRCVQENEGVV
jgi:hypothetical protein